MLKRNRQYRRNFEAEQKAEGLEGQPARSRELINSAL